MCRVSTAIVAISSCQISSIVSEAWLSYAALFSIGDIVVDIGRMPVALAAWMMISSLLLGYNTS